jgi:hypothetical protein
MKTRKNIMKNKKTRKNLIKGGGKTIDAMNELVHYIDSLKRDIKCFSNYGDSFLEEAKKAIKKSTISRFKSWFTSTSRDANRELYKRLLTSLSDKFTSCHLYFITHYEIDGKSKTGSNGKLDIEELITYVKDKLKSSDYSVDELKHISGKHDSDLISFLTNEKKKFEKTLSRINNVDTLLLSISNESKTVEQDIQHILYIVGLIDSKSNSYHKDTYKDLSNEFSVLARRFYNHLTNLNRHVEQEQRKNYDINKKKFTHENHLNTHKTDYLKKKLDERLKRSGLLLHVINYISSKDISSQEDLRNNVFLDTASPEHLISNNSLDRPSRSIPSRSIPSRSIPSSGGKTKHKRRRTKHRRTTKIIVR